MQKPATIHDIAREAGVSPATVSRVLSDSGYPVRASTRETVLRTAERLRYMPNLLGKQLKTNTSTSFAVVVPSITNPFYSSVLLGIEEVARKNGYDILLCNSFHDPKLEEQFLTKIFEKQVRGLLISSISQSKKLLRQLVQRGLNAVALDQEMSEKRISRVGFDYAKGGRMATAYLIEKGHTDVAYLTSPLDRPSRQSIHQGYAQAMREHGLTPVVVEGGPGESFDGNYEFACGRALIRTMAERSALPGALFCCNDMVAIGAIHELASRGVSVPGDVSVIGFDGIEFGRMITPALTTIEQPDY
ncbi:MAG TPA: LacI family DNA-binding transcriptional regulator, partial [Paenibacillus sp.]|nr:LacI family DNA-binding transcriptional regulator [Paenibacillus sp.]